MTRQGMLLRFVATVVLGITCVLLSVAWWPFLVLTVLVAAIWAVNEIRWVRGMQRLMLTEEGRAAAAKAADREAARQKPGEP